ncbi:MAG TPA: bifunctional acetate--CoA ligase family protein/GNAT family N-acetyltransferase [Stellaceae bacterium]|nr:bifunctional acetate--CoA ligase family protein/GNAT family N-acetyltransferase [Stellaceae bacterium]
MSVRNLDKLMKPKSLALIGATPRTGAVGAVVLRNLRRAGFQGPLMLVNPKHHALDGMPVYRDVQSLPETPDLAVIVTPPEAVPGLIATLGARGTRAAVVITAGFGELGERGRALQQATLEAAQPHLLRLVGPNCIGVMVPGAGLDASFSHIAPKAGDLAFVSQSGAMITAVLDWAAPRGIGFSHVVSLGDMADVDFGDMLDYLAEDGDTRAILLYVEAITHARKFMSAARAAARAKPVLAVKVGRFAESARAAASHTGVLAGSDAVYDAAFRRAGMLRVDTMAELFDAVETLALTRPQQGERLAIVTNGGGPGVLATDALIAAGGRLAELSPDIVAKLDAVLPRSWSHANPVDIIGDAPGKRYADTLRILMAEPAIDAVLALNAPTAMARPGEAAQAVIEEFKATPQSRLVGRNLLTAWLGEHSAAPARRRFAEARIASYETPDGAVRGFMHRVQYRRNQDLLMETPAARPDDFTPDATTAHQAIARTVAAGGGWLAAEDAAAVLGAYGIPLPASLVVADAAGAADAASAIGFPVALKIRSPDLTHKSDVGGVVLNLGTAEGVRTEATLMLERVKAAQPRARIDGFLVQAMVQRPGALELILGLIDDPTFGPVVMFGQGGTAVELLHDTTLELPPLNAALARAQMARTGVWRLLQGYRGQPPAAIDAIADTLIRVAQLAADHPEIRELDINPLLADQKGVLALDARIGVAPAHIPGAARLAISPYPKEFESTATLRDGTVIRLRPVRPEDEPLLQDLARHMNADDLRLRFFTPVTTLSHQLLARLSQIDYDRAMALIARPAVEGTALGIVRFAADPDNRRGEFAVSVRSDWKGRGLGYLLMTRIIEVARQRDLGEIFGEVLRENGAMLRVARALGFSVTTHPQEAHLLRLTKPL